MAVQWSGWAPEVFLTLDRSRGVPLRAQLEDQFRQAIRSGRLTAGERVPSSRPRSSVRSTSGANPDHCRAMQPDLTGSPVGA